MMYANNPAYKLELEKEGFKIYLPVNIMEGYHTSRLVELNNQLIYANAGATKDVLELAMTEIINRCNDNGFKTARTDIAAIAQSILYRTKYPVDQHCAIRVGAILSFMEADGVEEDPNKCESFWLEKKMHLAMKDPEVYAFFLMWGTSNIPQYREHLDTLTGLDYFVKRKEAILSIWGDLEQFKT